MDEVFIFDKSLQQRLQDYLDIFPTDRKRTIQQIKKEWNFFLEFAVDPSGWQAIWKIPRLICEEQSIPFPTVVLVYVESIDDNLLATIKIIGVQEDLILPERHVVCLKQLWPTKEQDKSFALNIESTANALDMYRFFYTNIMLPWDMDDDEESDWLTKHLECRLRLYFDMKTGVIPRTIAEHIRDLLTNARKLQAKREQIEANLSESDDEDYTNNKSIKTLMDLNVKLLEIKNEISLLENPVTRDVIIQRQKDLVPKNDDAKPQSWVIYDEGKIDDYINFLTHVKNLYPNRLFKFASNLSTMLSYITPKDTIILSKSNHIIRNINELENGGIIKGAFDKNQTTLTSFNEDIMLDFKGESLLENLTINATFSQCGILVRAGTTTLKKCKLIGNETSSTHQGILVLSGAKLELFDCEIHGFSTAIIGNSAAQITMINTDLCQNNIGIKVHDRCILKAENCTLNNSKEYGFCLETENGTNEPHKIGNFDILNKNPDICFKAVTGKNNGKGNVFISHKTKISPVQDIFSNPASSANKRKESQSEGTDEDMDVTVIERIGDAEQ